MNTGATNPSPATAGVPVALVLGMSIHGLAIARTLARHGIEVYAIEQSPAAPATATRYAKVLYADGINSERAADVVLQHRDFLPAGRPAVLYPSSDNMVRSIAANWAALAPYFRLSWSRSIDVVQRLVNKANLEEVCRQQDVLYPRSVLLHDPADIEAAVAAVGLPILVKPIRPLSGFKAIQIERAAQLADVVARYPGDLPFLVQRWIPGGDDTLYFCSMELADGEPVGCFTGRKLRAFPSGTGVGTVVESCPAPDVEAISRRFIAGLGLSGPIAIEYKRDPEGRYWLIEPNVGRTEYSVDLIIQHGVNFPLLEYYVAQGLPPPAQVQPRRDVIWYDTEREPLCYANLCVVERTLHPRGKTPVFPYFGHGDPAPLRRALERRAAQLAAVPANRLRRLLGGAGAVLGRYAAFDPLPAAAREFIAKHASANLFLSPAWFRNYEATVGRHEGEVSWYVVSDTRGRMRGVWPLLRTTERGRVILRAMGNYYTPYSTLPFDWDSPDAAQVMGSAVQQLLAGVDRLEVGPVVPDDRLLAAAREACPQTGFVARETVNWFQPVTDAASYFASLPGALRATIARKRRRLERRGALEFRIVRDHTGLDDALAGYEDVYERSWKRREPYPAFIEGLARCAADAGWLRLGLLVLDGRPLAAQLWLVADGVASIYKLAYDDACAADSPGTVLSWMMMRHVLERDGIRRLDYLTGNDDYKRDWMKEQRPLVRLTVANPLRPFGALFIARNLLERHGLQ